MTIRVTLRLKDGVERFALPRRALALGVMGVILIATALFLLAAWNVYLFETERLQTVSVSSEDTIPVLQHEGLEELVARVRAAPPLPTVDLPTSGESAGRDATPPPVPVLPNAAGQQTTTGSVAPLP